MKNIFFYIAIILLTASCAPKKTIKTVTVNYSNTIFLPTNIYNNVGDSLMLSIEPIDAKTINNEIYETANRDGSYEKEFLSYKKFILQNESTLNMNDKRKSNVILKIYDKIDDLVRNRQISSSIAMAFKEKIYHSYVLNQPYGFDGSEVYYLTKDEHYSSLNPYRINDKYFSLFRVTYNNKGNAIQKINIDNFQVSNGNELLYPFKNEYFEKTLERETEKLKYIYRMNMPNILTITPQQNIIKFVSIPAINTSNENLTISYINNDKVINYSFFPKTEIINEQYNFIPYHINMTGLPKSISNQNKHFIVTSADADPLVLEKNIVYIRDTQLNKAIKIYGICIDKDKVLFTEKTVLPSQSKNDIIKIKL